MADCLVSAILIVDCFRFKLIPVYSSPIPTCKSLKPNFLPQLEYKFILESKFTEKKPILYVVLPFWDAIGI